MMVKITRIILFLALLVFKQSNSGINYAPEIDFVKNFNSWFEALSEVQEENSAEKELFNQVLDGYFFGIFAAKCYFDLIEKTNSVLRVEVDGLVRVIGYRNAIIEFILICKDPEKFISLKMLSFYMQKIIDYPAHLCHLIPDSALESISQKNKEIQEVCLLDKSSFPVLIAKLLSLQRSLNRYVWELFLARFIAEVSKKDCAFVGAFCSCSVFQENQIMFDRKNINNSFLILWGFNKIPFINYAKSVLDDFDEFSKMSERIKFNFCPNLDFCSLISLYHWWCIFVKKFKPEIYLSKDVLCLHSDEIIDSSLPAFCLLTDESTYFSVSSSDISLKQALQGKKKVSEVLPKRMRLLNWALRTGRKCKSFFSKLFCVD